MKKYLLLFIFALFLVLPQSLWAATYTAVAAGGDWNTAATWGGTGAQYPHAGDTAIINATMTGTVSISTAAACEVLNLTNNGGTVAFNAVLTVGASATGSVILGGTLTASGGGIKIGGATTLTGSSLTFPGTLEFATGGIVKLSGSWINSGLVTFSAAQRVNYNSSSAETLTCTNGITLTSVTGNPATATIILAGGTLTATVQTYQFYNPIIINPTTGNITIANGSYLGMRGATFVYTHSGTNTVTTTGSILFLVSATLDVASDDGVGHIVWDTVMAVNGTTTLSTDLWCNTLIIQAETTPATFPVLTVTTGKTIHVATALKMNGSTAPTGTCTIASSTTSVAYLIYSGTLTNSNVSNMTFTYIDASSSTTPIFNYNGGTLTGTVNIFNKNATDLNVMSQIY